ncbi:DUF3298 and DUF4163 domain-containing protein [Neobacillus sp. 114]|uniref:DUF3298 and DUF4163 domain-containing protein n=1 Tax=Neobacillus sp. 114 TaxID=3048535 RepID=UPI0024C45E35|nr:DUF3298 and DUF4163 domain-containing protein [Neobacillus sp. 114]
MPIILPVEIKQFIVRDGPKKEVIYPQVVNLRNQQLERYINQTIVQQTQKLIDTQVGDMPSTVSEMLGTFEMKNNQRTVLSLNLSNYTYHEHAAHGMTYIKSLTFDFQKETLVQLKDLFKPGSDYIKRLTTLIQEQIKKRDIFLLGDFTGIKPDQDFYIADKTLVIYFQLYDITPYAFGFPIFPISVYELMDILDESGTLGRMAENN